MSIGQTIKKDLDLNGLSVDMIYDIIAFAWYGRARQGASLTSWKVFLLL